MPVDLSHITALSWISRIIFILIQYLPLKRINGANPPIYGDWKSKYHELTEQKADEEVAEVIKLEQFYSYVRGVGRPVRATNTEFVFMGRILSGVFEGQFFVKNSNNPSGRGFFQLIIIAPSHITMDGCCIWIDRDTGKIESSKYEWNKL